MFLNILNDAEKKAFLQLAMICAKADGVIREEENEVLQAYCDEMDIQMPKFGAKIDYIIECFDNEKEKYNSEIKEILSNFSATRAIDPDTGMSKEIEFDYYGDMEDMIFEGKIRLCNTLKIAYFELIALIYSDGEVPPIEADILRRLEPGLNTKELENLAIYLTNQLNFVKTIELLNARSK
ncbi:MAG: hypothetical protein ACTTIM_00480 [Campylobacter sp.]